VRSNLGPGAALLLVAFAAAGCCGDVVIYNYDAADTEVHEFSGTAESVDTPDYVLDVTGILLVTDADGIVQSASGSATLTEGSVLGQRYVVVDAAGLDTQATLDEAYLGGDDSPLGSEIAASEFMLEGDDLGTPTKRTVIIANGSNGVRAYQAFEVTFHAPP